MDYRQPQPWRVLQGKHGVTPTPARIADLLLLGLSVRETGQALNIRC
jgi:DNA-binding CsgD family transcriptional regulator